MQTSKYPFIEKDVQPRKWHVSDLLLLTTLISEQILRNGFEKTAPFLSYIGGFCFLQALLRSIINRGAWSTDMCLFLWTALLRPLAGARTTTADSADCSPETAGIGTGSDTSLLKALLQKKPSGQDDIHKKYWTKKIKFTFTEILIQQTKQLPTAFCLCGYGIKWMLSQLNRTNLRS